MPGEACYRQPVRCQLPIQKHRRKPLKWTARRLDVLNRRVHGSDRVLIAFTLTRLHLNILDSAQPSGHMRLTDMADVARHLQADPGHDGFDK